MRKSSLLATLWILSILITGVLLLEYCKPTTDTKKVNSAPNAYVGDETCISCHKPEYDKWKKSHHYMAMLPANDSSVFGDFNDVTLKADGITSRFFKREGKFIIQTEGSDGEQHDFEVLYTFGFYPLQQYLVAFPKGRMQVPRVSWDAIKKKWFHQYAGEKIHHRDWLHWSRDAQNWNTMCASCHSTNLQKNYFAQADSFHTTWSTINVSCETCHGPASKHLQWANSEEGKNKKGPAHAYLREITSADNNTLINTCAPCHARKADISAQPMLTKEFLDDYIPEIPSTEFFHADGQVDDEDYIYTSFLQSKMYVRGVQCNNCHDSHSAQLKLPGNAACLQCHAPKYDSFEHHKHPATAKADTASKCVSCHMPGKFYMGNDLRHDHSFRVPRPDQSVQYNTPNACNHCHTNQSAQWAADAVKKWYGPKRTYHFSDDLIPGSKLDPSSEAHLQKLLSDSAIPGIVKATAVHYLGDMATAGSLKAILGQLQHENAHIRYRSVRALADFPWQSWREPVMPLLNDPVRAVRIAAADLLSALPADQIPANWQSAFAKAEQENQAYLFYQVDFSVGNLMVADHYFKQNRLPDAEYYYLRALQKDSMINYARLNLSAIYNSMGNNAKALETLLIAANTDPRNDRVYYNLGLLYNELQDPQRAKAAFARAVALKSSNPRLYYNYGVLLQQMGEQRQAEQMILEGLKMVPGIRTCKMPSNISGGGKIEDLRRIMKLLLY